MSESTPAIRRMLLRVPNRRRIYEAVVATPGTHARRLSRELPMALGSVEHHVRVLERHTMVYTVKEGRRRTVFAVGQLSPTDAPMVDVLRKPAWARLLADMAGGQEAGVSAIAARLGLPATTVSYNLRRLHARGVLEHLRIGRESVYLVRDGERLERLLRLLRPLGGDDAPDAAFRGVVGRARAGPDAGVLVQLSGEERTVRCKH